MARRVWPKSAGKSVDGYVEEATIQLTKAGFERKLLSYVRAMQPEQSLDPRTVDVLFGITREFLQRRSAVSAMKTARVEDDWKRRKRLLASLERSLAEVRDSTGQALRRKELPLTCTLAQSVHQKLALLAAELDKVTTLQRVQESMFRTLRQSVRGEKEHVWLLNRYLEERFAEVPQAQRDIIIAGAMAAAGIKSADLHKDPVANLPMARSRAARRMGDEDGIVVRWLDEAEAHTVDENPQPLLVAPPKKGNAT